MADSWEVLGEEIFTSFKEAAKDFIDEQGVKDFLKDTAMDFAKQKWKAESESDKDLKAQHEQNLLHLASQRGGEMDRYQVALNKEGKDFLTGLVQMAGGFLVKVAPKLIGLA